MATVQTNPLLTGISEAAVGGDGAPANVPDEVAFSPTSGQTVAFNASNRNQIMRLTPAVPLAELTIEVTHDEDSRIGQSLYIYSSQAILAITFTGSILRGAPAGFQDAQITIHLLKISATEWGYQT